MSGTTGFPLAAPGKDGRLGFARDADAVRQALWTLLLTSPGERLMRPAFGAGLRDFIGQPNTETTRGLIATAIRAAIAQHEARVDVAALRVTPDPVDAARVSVVLDYARRGAPGGADRLTLALDLGPR